MRLVLVSLLLLSLLVAGCTSEPAPGPAPEPSEATVPQPTDEPRRVTASNDPSTPPPPKERLPILRAMPQNASTIPVTAGGNAFVLDLARTNLTTLLLEPQDVDGDPPHAWLLAWPDGTSPESPERCAARASDTRTWFPLHPRATTPFGGLDTGRWTILALADGPGILTFVFEDGMIDEAELGVLPAPTRHEVTYTGLTSDMVRPVAYEAHLHHESDPPDAALHLLHAAWTAPYRSADAALHAGIALDGTGCPTGPGYNLTDGTTRHLALDTVAAPGAVTLDAWANATLVVRPTFTAAILQATHPGGPYRLD